MLARGVSAVFGLFVVVLFGSTALAQSDLGGDVQIGQSAKLRTLRVPLVFSQLLVATGTRAAREFPVRNLSIDRVRGVRAYVNYEIFGEGHEVRPVEDLGCSTYLFAPSYESNGAGISVTCVDEPNLNLERPEDGQEGFAIIQFQ